MVNNLKSLGLFGSALAGTLVGVFASVAYLNSPPQVAPQSQPLEFENNSVDLSELTLAIDSLRISNDSIRKRLMELENRPEGNMRTPINGFASVDDMESLERKIEASLGSSGNGDSTQFKEKVAESLEEIRHEELAAKYREGHQRSIDSLEIRVSKASEWLDLDSYQSGELRTALIARDQGNTEVLNLWESGADEATISEAKQATSQTFWSHMDRVLTPEQFNRYQSRSSGKNN